MNKKLIKITESDIKSIVKNSVKRILSEAEDNGWIVDDDNAQEALEFLYQQIGEEEANAAIVRTLGDVMLAKSLAYIFRQYNLTDWQS